jgi:hypothetical protein
MSSNAIVGAHGRDITAAETADMAAQPTKPSGPTTFHDVLEALNPLQYLPVIGSIYRVATGEEGSSTLQTAVSLVSGLAMGGPIGLLTSMAGTIAEHYFNVEHYARSLIAPSASPAAPVALASAKVATPATTPAQTSAVAPAGPSTAAAASPPSPATAATTPPALAPAIVTDAPVQAATAHLAAQAVATYTQIAQLSDRVVPGGREA